MSYKVVCEAGLATNRKSASRFEECLTQWLPGVEVVTEVHGLQVLVAGQIITESLLFITLRIRIHSRDI